MHSNCILDSVANLLVHHMVFVGNVQKSPIASHLKGDTIFPIISQWGLSVAMETRVLIQSAKNLLQPYPQLQ